MTEMDPAESSPCLGISIKKENDSVGPETDSNTCGQDSGLEQETLSDFIKREQNLQEIQQNDSVENCQKETLDNIGASCMSNSGDERNQLNCIKTELSDEDTPGCSTGRQDDTSDEETIGFPNHMKNNVSDEEQLNCPEDTNQIAVHVSSAISEDTSNNSDDMKVEQYMNLMLEDKNQEDESSNTEEQDPLQCELCGQRFSLRDSLRKHIRRHTEGKQFKCEHCEKCFHAQSDLTVHIRTHTGEKPFKCEHCGKSFSTQGNLNSHIRTHTGEKPFHCLQCGKYFSGKSKLTRHIRTHTGEKPFSCEQCGKYFSERGNLNAHIRIHTGEKPFKCGHCGKSFNCRRNLNGHMLTHLSNPNPL